MEPFSWGTFFTYLGYAATAVTAISAIEQGNAAKESAEYNAKVMQNNAETARNQAGAREEAIRRQARQQLGAQRAAIAQSGTGLGGSNLDIAEQSAVLAELDALNARYEGELQGRGLIAQAEQEKRQGRRARAAGYMSAGASLLSGASNAYGNNYKLRPRTTGGTPYGGTASDPWYG